MEENLTLIHSPPTKKKTIVGQSLTLIHNPLEEKTVEGSLTSINNFNSLGGKGFEKMFYSFPQSSTLPEEKIVGNNKYLVLGSSQCEREGLYNNILPNNMFTSERVKEVGWDRTSFLNLFLGEGRIVDRK